MNIGEDDTRVIELDQDVRRLFPERELRVQRRLLSWILEDWAAQAQLRATALI